MEFELYVTLDNEPILQNVSSLMMIIIMLSPHNHHHHEHGVSAMM